MKNKSTWRTFSGLRFTDKLALGEAAFFLAWARLKVRFFSFKVLAAKLGHLSKVSPIIVKDLTAATQVKRAIQRTHTKLPWENVCLPQAIAAMRMLTRRKIPASLYFGVITEHKTDSMKAHAWVQVGDFFITGKKGSQKYATVAVFSNIEKI